MPEWQEIEALLIAPDPDSDTGPHARRGIHSFVFVAAALVLGGGVLTATLMGTRGDCGSACQQATAGASATATRTAGLAPRSDANLTEGRSAAETSANGPDGAKADAAAPEAPAPHRHHHHRHRIIEPH